MQLVLKILVDPEMLQTIREGRSRRVPGGEIYPSAELRHDH
jgi:hypothetical protein